MTFFSKKNPRQNQFCIQWVMMNSTRWQFIAPADNLPTPTLQYPQCTRSRCPQMHWAVMWAERDVLQPATQVSLLLHAWSLGKPSSPDYGLSKVMISQLLFLCSALVSVMASRPLFVNVSQWIVDNEKDFLPPVCNKLMWVKSHFLISLPWMTRPDSSTLFITSRTWHVQWPSGIL